MAEKKKKSIFKTYNQAEQTRVLEKANKAADADYKTKNKAKLNQAKVDAENKKGVVRSRQQVRNVQKDTISSERMSPYTTPNSRKSNYRKTTTGIDYPDYKTTSPSKEPVTGNLSTKEPVKVSNTSNSSNKMSWARDAERKARKLMGGK